MRRWIGLLGSWALFVLAIGLAAFAIAGEMINLRDLRRLDRVAVIDRMIAERAGSKTFALRQTASSRAAEVGALQSKIADAQRQQTDLPDTGQTIIISTAENHLYVRRGGQTVFDAVCSTGKGTTMAIDGKTLVFDTPIGKLRIKSKDENPQWVPPDWHYIEQARKNGMRVVRLGPGDVIDANTGGPAQQRSEGVWSWFGGGRGASSSTMRVKGDTVVVKDGGVERELPPGKIITAGGAIVIPPINSKQRHFDKVLGRFRLNLGDGYAIHGTQETDKLGQAVSHGCVRLGDADIERLYQMANVGDVVIIY
jgi:lipoprotein-anchoring transpeptidase ErfK/SrfK